jgi:hypothetical protein
MAKCPKCKAKICIPGESRDVNSPRPSQVHEDSTVQGAAITASARKEGIWPSALSSIALLTAVAGIAYTVVAYRSVEARIAEQVKSAVNSTSTHSLLVKQSQLQEAIDDLVRQLDDRIKVLSSRLANEFSKDLEYEETQYKLLGLTTDAALMCAKYSILQNERNQLVDAYLASQLLVLDSPSAANREGAKLAGEELSEFDDRQDLVSVRDALIMRLRVLDEFLRKPDSGK